MGDFEKNKEDKTKSKGKHAYELTFEDLKRDSMAGRGMRYEELQDPNAIARYIEKMERLEIEWLSDERNTDPGLIARFRRCEESGGGVCYKALEEESEHEKALITERYYKDKEAFMSEREASDDLHEELEFSDQTKKTELDNEDLTTDENLLLFQAQVDEAKSDYAKFLRDANDAHEKSVLMAIPVLKKSESLYSDCLELSNGIEKFCTSEELYFKCFHDMKKTYVETTQLDDVIQKKYSGDFHKYIEVTGKLHSMRDALFQKLTDYENSKKEAEDLLEAELKAYDRLSGPEARALQKRYEDRLRKLQEYKKSKR